MPRGSTRSRRLSRARAPASACACVCIDAHARARARALASACAYACIDMRAHADARAHECLRRAIDSACPCVGASAPSAAWMVAIDRFLAPTPVASSRQLTRSEVQNILAFLEARPTSRSMPTTAQDAAVAVSQWPEDTQSTAEEPLPTARRPRPCRVI